MMGEYLEKQGCTKDDASRVVTGALRNVCVIWTLTLKSSFLLRQSKMLSKHVTI